MGFSDGIYELGDILNRTGGQTVFKKLDNVEALIELSGCKSKDSFFKKQ